MGFEVCMRLGYSFNDYELSWYTWNCALIAMEQHLFFSADLHLVLCDPSQIIWQRLSITSIQPAKQGFWSEWKSVIVFGIGSKSTMLVVITQTLSSLMFTDRMQWLKQHPPPIPSFQTLLGCYYDSLCISEDHNKLLLALLINV